MNDLSTHQTAQKPAFKRFLVGGLIAGILVAVINHLYAFFYLLATGFNPPAEVSYYAITGASILPILVGALGYFILSRLTEKATLIYIIGATILALLTCLGPLNYQLSDGSPVPDGFLGFTIPMHLISGLVAITFLPWYVYRR